MVYSLKFKSLLYSTKTTWNFILNTFKHFQFYNVFITKLLKLSRIWQDIYELCKKSPACPIAHTYIMRLFFFFLTKKFIHCYFLVNCVGNSKEIWKKNYVGALSINNMEENACLYYNRSFWVIRIQHGKYQNVWSTWYK